MDSVDVGGDTSRDNRLLLLGTAHVSPSSLKAVEAAVEEFDPDVVAVELCERRFVAPFSSDPVRFFDGETTVHLRTIFFLPILQYLQSRTAAEFGLGDETDMGTAIIAAANTGSSLALLDRDILGTFANYWPSLPLREALRVGASVLSALVRGKSSLMDTRNPGSEEFVSPERVDEYLSSVRETFPTFASVFIDERDRIMARRLNWLTRRDYRVVAVVGAAHKPGIEAALEEVDEERVELKNPVIGGIQKIPDLAAVLKDSKPVDGDDSVTPTKDA
jgi:pheromone shutdown protein TraB